jgi:predicted molibdopterin-dependent oxidoreductase YjgC
MPPTSPPTPPASRPWPSGCAPSPGRDRLTGLSEADLRTAARWFGESPATLSLYCQGLNQSASGTDKNAALINLHLATGQIGRPAPAPSA